MRNNNTDNSVMAMNMEERKMEKIMRTGIIATSTVAATGLVFGMSPVEVHAEEHDANTSEPAVQAPSEVSAPETLADAQLAADAARAEAEAADAAVEEAAGKVSEAQTAFDIASESAETARSEAEKAFEDAKAEAAEADADAQSNVQAAEKEVVEAESRVQQAEEEAASAEASLEEAENSVKEAESENPTTESDLSEKEAELADAETDLADAEKDFEEAERARNEAADEAQQKETARNDAENTVKDAEAEKADADTAAVSAKDAAGQAEKELQSAEDLKNGTLDIKDTVQYKEEQAAKQAMDKAAVAAETAARDTDKAAEDLEKAGTAVETAEKELDLAAGDLDNRESALAEAEKAKNAADTAREKAQEAYDDVASRAADADAAVSLADKAMAEAKDGVKTAETAKTAADNAVKKAEEAVADARNDAEAAANADIAAAQKAAAEKQSATEAAQKALDEAADKYEQGTLGLIDWMLAKEGLTKEQKKDLTAAREVLVNASEEDISQWYDFPHTGVLDERGGKVVVIGDHKDATNLENLFRSIDFMKMINELRATDDNFTGDLQRNESPTNFYFMAVAEAGAMRGAGVMGHTCLLTTCENLAFGYIPPTYGWYTREKAKFDRIKGELGITKITSMDEVRRIEKEADDQGVEVGHYTNLFMAVDQAMGVGFTQYRTTSCYNASRTFDPSVDPSYMGMHLYSVEEFEQLAEEYYQSVDKSACEERLNSASAAQTEAENRLQALIDNKDTVVAAAVQNASSLLASKKSDAEAAAQALAVARETLAAAETDSQGAHAVKLSADQALQNALTALNRAAEESRAADTGYALAEKARDDAGKAVTEAESALKNAMTGRESATAVLEEKKAALTDANTTLHEAQALHDSAEKKLADLTSDDTLNALREQKQAADSALKSALTKQSTAAEALKQAKAVLAQAEKDAASATTSLQEADTLLAQAAGLRDSAKQAADKTARDLEKLREQYTKVLRAIDARDTAKEKMRQAEAARGKAESDLSAARTGLAAAQAAKAITGDKLLRATGLSVEAALLEEIEDPDFMYLNDYVSVMKKADTERLSAREGLDLATAELSSRKIDSTNAQKAYTAALADLEIIRNRVEMSHVNPDPVPEVAPSVKAAEYSESVIQDVSGTAGDADAIASEAGRKNSGDTVRKATQKTSESTARKAATVATGDTSNIMEWLAGLLASTVCIFLDFKRRKGRMKDVR